MLLLAKAVYNTVLRECYSQESSATLSLSTKTITLDLVTLPGIACDFPAGVLLQLIFVDSQLDTAQLYNSFNFSTTKQLVVNLYCADPLCTAYDDVYYLKFRIDSAYLSTELAVGAVMNERTRSSECASAYSVFYMYPNDDPALCTMMLLVKTVCKKLQRINVTAVTVSTTMHDDSFVGFRYEGVVGMVNGGFLIIPLNNLTYYNAVIKQSAKKTDVVLEGWIDGIFVTQIVLPQGVNINNAKSYIQGWRARLSRSEMAVTIYPGTNYGDLPEMLANGTMTHVMASVIITFNAVVTYYILYNVDKTILLHGGTLLCADAVNEQLCLKALLEFENYNHLAVFVIPTMQYYRSDVLIHAETFYVMQGNLISTCFACADVYATPDAIQVNFTLRAQTKGCTLEYLQNTIIEVSYFATKSDRISADKNSIKKIAAITAPFSTKNLSISIPCDKQIFAALKTQFAEAYSMQISFLRFQDAVPPVYFADNAEVDDFQYSDSKRVRTMNFALVGGFTAGVIACGAIEQVVRGLLSRRKKIAVHKKAEALDDI